MIKARKNFFKNKQQTFLFLIVVILAVGFLSYDNYSKKQLAREEAVETFEENIPVQCENGKWIKFPELLNSNQFEKFTGNERLSYD
jgi:predicted negative regulator of RcsB-dependent stress response